MFPKITGTSWVRRHLGTSLPSGKPLLMTCKSALTRPLILGGFTLSELRWIFMFFSVAWCSRSDVSQWVSHSLMVSWLYWCDPGEWWHASQPWRGHWSLGGLHWASWGEFLSSLNWAEWDVIVLSKDISNVIVMTIIAMSGHHCYDYDHRHAA